MTSTILLVDDDANLLLSFERQFRRSYTVLTSPSGKEALLRIKDNPAIELVISDMNMPEMNGIQFLSRVKEMRPAIIRIMLTGRTDLNVAMQAVNEGSIFRFLAKPVTPETLERTINDGLEQYRLVNSEKILLGKTLNGSLDILNELLSLTNPIAFGRSCSIKKIVQHIITRLELENQWQYELAANLCLIGFITIPQNIQEKIHKNIRLNQDEKDLVDRTPQIAHGLLCKIPRFEGIAEMILNQSKPFYSYETEKNKWYENPVIAGGQILKTAIDLDGLINAGVSSDEAIGVFIRNELNLYNPQIAVTLLDYFVEYKNYTQTSLKVNDLKIGMTLDQDVYSNAGALLLIKGQEITEAVLPRIWNFEKYVGVREPILVLLPVTEEKLR